MMAVLRAYWPTVRKYRGLAVIMMLLMVLTALNRSAYPFLLRNLMEGLSEKNDDLVTRTTWLIVGLFVLTSVGWYFLDVTNATFEANAMKDLSRRCFAIIQSHSIRFFENTFAGSLVTSARRFRNSFETLTDAIAYQVGRSFVMIILTLVVFVQEYPWLALAFAIWSVVFCTASVAIARLRVKRDTIAAEKDSALSGAFADSFGNESTVKSFGREEDEQRRFDAVAEDYCQSQKRAWYFGSLLMRVQGVISLTFELMVILMLVWGWQHGTVTAADFVFFQTYVLILMYQMWDIGNIMHKVFRSVADAKEMAQIFSQQSEVQDIPGARPLTITQGQIEFRNVQFSYLDRDAREHHDVNDFTLRLLPGQTIALVGHTGAGKSTIVKLLMRYFDLSSGKIIIDHQDIAHVTQLSLRQKIAVVSQQPELFHRTLRDNIAFAKPEASEEEVIAAAKRAFAWDFISAFPDGLDTLVGERGVKLSGGERQRIALARAFLANAPILVLDEATSALDSKTEYQIQAAIADLLQGRTCIVIAHRLSTIRRADRIIVMERGSIIEEGTHNDLLLRQGVYADLWDHQTGGYITD